MNITIRQTIMKSRWVNRIEAWHKIDTFIQGEQDHSGETGQQGSGATIFCTPLFFLLVS